MKNSLIISFFIIFCTHFNKLIAQSVTIDKIPATIEEFIQLRDNKATSPEGGAAMFCIAMKIYSSNKELGEKCFVAIADKSELTTGSTYKGYTISSWFTIQTGTQRYPLIANSYILGSTPENGYTVKLPYTYKFSSNAYSGDPSTGTTKIFVACSGADSPRPIHMVKNDKGIWKASKWSSLFVGMRAVKQNVVDDI